MSRRGGKKKKEKKVHGNRYEQFSKADQMAREADARDRHQTPEKPYVPESTRPQISYGSLNKLRKGYRVKIEDDGTIKEEYD